MTILRTSPRVLSVVAVLGLAIVAGFAYSAWRADSGRSQDPTSGYAVPVTSDSARQALDDAVARAGFTPLVPGVLATSAATLVAVDSSAGPNGNGMKLVEFIYAGEETVRDGVPVRAALEMFQTNVRLNQANGELWQDDLAGYEVHRHVVSVDGAGETTKATYTARSADFTLVMDFTGEQPTADALEAMLGSLEAHEG